MKNIAIGVVAAASLTLTARSAENSRETESLPVSMVEFVNWHLDHGACGTWTDNGVTKDMWVGIPAGLQVVTTSKTWYDVPTGQLYSSHHMATEDGRMISTGANVMSWDADRKAVLSASSGFDMGKPYSGTAVLVGMTGDALSWEYTERSQGKTTVYENVVTYTGRNTRISAVKVKNGDGKPWVSEANRSNPAMQLLAKSGFVGTWEQSAADGSIWRQVVSWGADEHVLKFEGMSRTPSGEWESDSLAVWYWDPDQDCVATIFLDDHGTVINGRIDSVTRSGESVTVVSSHGGNRFGGLTMSTVMTQVLTGDTMATSFQGMSLDGVRHKLSWSESTGTRKRVE